VIKIVQYDPYCDLMVVGEVSDYIQRFDLIAQIEVIGGFIQQHNAGLLRQAGSKPDPLEFTAREGARSTVCYGI
jgi:hypothetical protein